MKKIMFNDKFNLTECVLSGFKTMTRRTLPNDVYGELSIEYNPLRIDEHRYGVNSHSIKSHFPTYQVGEVVAIAQNYSKIAEKYPYWDYITAGIYEDNPGWNNKMFVKASLMPNKIKITKVRAERLQEITDADILREGVFVTMGQSHSSYCLIDDSNKTFTTPKEAFEYLIDKVSGKGTWNSNPYVFVYEFELLSNKYETESIKY